MDNVMYDLKIQVSASNTMAEFLDFINYSALVDLELRRGGGDFTWSRSGEATTFSRLDRFLISVDWAVSWPNLIQKTLPHCVSDLYPICLEKLVVHKGKPPFRFENMWLQADGFTTPVNNWWNQFEVMGMLAKSLQGN